MIIWNAAACTKCGDIVESLHRHDYRSCSCMALSVDGGRDYLKRCYNDYNDVIELSVESCEPYAVVRQFAYKLIRREVGNGFSEIYKVPFTKLSDEDIQYEIDRRGERWLLYLEEKLFRNGE